MARRICDVEKFEFTAIGENHNQGHIPSPPNGFTILRVGLITDSDLYLKEVRWGLYLKRRNSNYKRDHQKARGLSAWKRGGIIGIAALTGGTLMAITGV
ncbi:uncharacterized protein [Henckelia pumila]|uniref:uncharacterized protein isoform X2 n=1 Tax=Henckelia pumila TaxID=405737 RepID=UPI003C6E1403